MSGWTGGILLAVVSTGLFLIGQTWSHARMLSLKNNTDMMDLDKNARDTLLISKNALIPDFSVNYKFLSTS